MLGLLGLPFALLVRLSLREPPRGALDRVQAAAAPLPFGATLRQLFSHRSFVWLLVASSCISVGSYGLLGWSAEFFVRVHEMTRQQVGFRLGALVMIFGCIGIASGGWITDRLGARDVRAYMRVPALTYLASLPFAMGFLWSPTPGLALWSFAPAYLLLNMFVGPLWSTTQNLARPETRATASAVLLFILNIVGLGGGSFAVGWLNDVLAGRYADRSIRYSLTLTMAFGAIGVVCFWIGSRSLERDLEDVAGSAS